jgi:hypothetical protein
MESKEIDKIIYDDKNYPIIIELDIHEILLNSYSSDPDMYLLAQDLPSEFYYNTKDDFFKIMRLSIDAIGNNCVEFIPEINSPFDIVIQPWMIKKINIKKSKIIQPIKINFE